MATVQGALFHLLFTSGGGCSQGRGRRRALAPQPWGKAAAGRCLRGAARGLGLNVALCAFSPQRHGCTLKSLVLGLVGTRGGGRGSSPEPPHDGLMGGRPDYGNQQPLRGVLEDDDRWWLGRLFGINASRPRITARTRSAAPAAQAALWEPGSGPSPPDRAAPSRRLRARGGFPESFAATSRGVERPGAGREREGRAPGQACP